MSFLFTVRKILRIGDAVNVFISLGVGIFEDKFNLHANQEKRFNLQLIKF
ncbi:hypothetical protein J2W55_002795 [Mucilaginibacter pocheonensis]|uniref:Uncharacterized protein n=1 Tax=Mucilaginibacter pocheonensis TaxID=398050 RepID=A0ABU1TC15_9SPHI|nr:hypothetical protein [Mucilaginibacter pocheonensis]